MRLRGSTSEQDIGKLADLDPQGAIWEGKRAILGLPFSFLDKYLTVLGFCAFSRKNNTVGKEFEMATEEQIAFLFERLEKIRPGLRLQQLEERNVGSGAVLRYLYEVNETATAGNISEYMNVSTARMAVLLKRMESLGWIRKSSQADDARVTVVRLTPAGEERIRKMRQDLWTALGHVIDQVGMEKLNLFLEVAEEIRAAVPPPEDPD